MTKEEGVHVRSKSMPDCFSVKILSRCLSESELQDLFVKYRSVCKEVRTERAVTEQDVAIVKDLVQNGLSYKELRTKYNLKANALSTALRLGALSLVKEK